MAALIGVLKFIEYRYFVKELSIEIYIGIVAILFTVLGIWMGLKLINKKKEELLTEPFVKNESLINKFGISNREYEVLELMAKGLSNQEIADQLFISLPTVKTHVSNLFVKLDVERRTQAIKRAKESHLIP